MGKVTGLTDSCRDVDCNSFYRNITYKTNDNSNLLIMFYPEEYIIAILILIRMYACFITYSPNINHIIHAILNLPINSFCPLDTSMVITLDNFYSMMIEKSAGKRASKQNKREILTWPDS